MEEGREAPEAGWAREALEGQNPAARGRARLGQEAGWAEEGRVRAGFTAALIITTGRIIMGPEGSGLARAWEASGALPATTREAADAVDAGVS